MVKPSHLFRIALKNPREYSTHIEGVVGYVKDKGCVRLNVYPIEVSGHRTRRAFDLTGPNVDSNVMLAAMPRLNRRKLAEIASEARSGIESKQGPFWAAVSGTANALGQEFDLTTFEDAN